MDERQSVKIKKNRKAQRFGFCEPFCETFNNLEVSAVGGYAHLRNRGKKEAAGTFATFNRLII